MKRLTWLFALLLALPLAAAQDEFPVAAIAGFVALWFFFILLMLAGWVLWIFMLIDCATRKDLKDNEKIVWVIVLALTQVIGAVIYFFAVKRKS